MEDYVVSVTALSFGTGKPLIIRRTEPSPNVCKSYEDLWHISTNLVDSGPEHPPFRPKHYVGESEGSDGDKHRGASADHASTMGVERCDLTPMSPSQARPSQGDSKDLSTRDSTQWRSAGAGESNLNRSKSPEPLKRPAKFIVVYLGKKHEFDEAVDFSWDAVLTAANYFCSCVFHLGAGVWTSTVRKVSCGSRMIDLDDRDDPDLARIVQEIPGADREVPTFYLNAVFEKWHGS